MGLCRRVARDRIGNRRQFSSPGSNDGLWPRPRQALRRVIQRHAEPGPGRALLLALVVGDRSALTPDLSEVLRDSGTSHLFVVSGLHVGIVVGKVMLVLRLAGTPLGFGACAGGIFAVGYAALVGFGLPDQRALTGALLVLAALMLRRQLSTVRIFAFALMAVCLINPLTTLGASCWMSFGTVGMLLMGCVGYTREQPAGAEQQTLARKATN